ncbi:hypothetical protein KEM54_002125 [Ascosphaera aggregata]|nr:hypothetical protein KEM54_002125 [Ascosphaera aggregata]
MSGVASNTNAATQIEKKKEQDLFAPPATSNIVASRSVSLPLRRLSAPASPSPMPSRPCDECKEGLSQHLGAGTRRSRRRPTNLTIQTPKWDSSFVAVLATSSTSKNAPPTPYVQRDMSSEAECRPRRYLHHYKSSPSVLPSPSLREPLTSTIVTERPEEEMMAEQRDGHDSNTTTEQLQSQPDSQTESEAAIESKTDKLKARLDDMCCSPPPTRESHQESPRGYPNGPICIYDEGLYLYLEPEVENLSSFDVVVNVAEEVRNPYKTAIAEGKPLGSTINSKQEYVHVPWSHNSEILRDLLPLCRFIDSRISQSKRVLIHCQLGVSRSASLVIAYGLYKNPDKDFNEMYRVVKERSEWVGPNLGLIYQLMEFRGQVIRGNHEPPRDIPQSWFKSPGCSKEEGDERDRGATELVPSSCETLPSLVANHGHSCFMHVPDFQHPTEPTSSSVIKTSFFANDNDSSDKTSDPPVGSTTSSSPPLSFADSTLRLRRSSHTSKPLPLRQMFEKTTDAGCSSKEPSASPPTPSDHSQCSQQLSLPPLGQEIADSSLMGVSAIGEDLKEETPATISSSSTSRDYSQYEPDTCDI